MKRFLKKFKHKTRPRTRYKSLMNKAKTVPYIYRTDGSRGVMRAVGSGIKKRVKRPPTMAHAGDVLFVSIDEPLLDRYRTDHMMESLESVGMSVGKIFYYELKPEHIKRYSVFVFYRCPWVPEFKNIFKEIRKKNKISIYAVDDLVIDTKYTDNLPVVRSLNAKDRDLYDDGVKRHGRLMENCDFAITTTKGLADELIKYKNLKDVYIDRNSMSSEMVHHATEAIKTIKRDDEKIIIGYFSGTATHNEDFQMIAPALVRILQEYDNVYVKLAGRIDAPESLVEYKDRLLFSPYVDWKRLPYELCECHINLSPLVNTLFNRAKSEIKWAESALVEVPVVASNIGAFKESVEDGVTGVLVENTDESWYKGIRALIEDKNKRELIGRQSRSRVVSDCVTTGRRALELRNFILSKMPPVVAFCGVSLGALSGGNMVVKKHMDILRESGCIVYGLESMNYQENDKWQSINDADDIEYDIFRINSRRKKDRIALAMSFDRLVATFWASVDMVDGYKYMKENGKKLYLVQNFEPDFYKLTDKNRLKTLATYSNPRLIPITISKWCKGWLADNFGRKASYAPNGIDISRFTYKDRKLDKRKIKVLIEGDSSSDYKRVDESFEIANKLDKNKYEVSYMSYNAPPKDWYSVDNVYIKVPYEEVGDIYASHDILIKSSILESFSYPPLEMMATGGVVVLVKNDGNAEYVKDGVNALCYRSGNIDEALDKIKYIAEDKKAFYKIARKGREVALSRDWSGLKDMVVGLYE